MSVCVRRAKCPSGPVISREDLIGWRQNNRPPAKTTCAFHYFIQQHTQAQRSAGSATDLRDGKSNSSSISNQSNVFRVTV